MTAPVFVTFTSGAAITTGTSIRISTQAPVSLLEPVTPGFSGSDGSLSAVTRVSFSNGSGPVLVSGSVTTTASALGVVASSGPRVLCNTPLGNTAYGSLGTDAVSVAGTQYWAELFNPTDRTLTNIACLNGTTAGTDKAIYFIADSAGTILGTTALAGVTCSGTDAFQSIALTAPITLLAGCYYVGFQVNGTTTKHRTMAANTFPNTTGSVAGAFGTISAITPAGTFTAGVGPFVRLT